MALSKMTFSIMNLIGTRSIQDTQQNDIQHIDNRHNELNHDTQYTRHTAKQHSAYRQSA